MFAMFLHTQELRPCLSKNFFSFSEILILVIFIVQPWLLLSRVKNVGLRIAAVHGQHSLVQSLIPPVSVRMGNRTIHRQTSYDSIVLTKDTRFIRSVPIDGDQ